MTTTDIQPVAGLRADQGTWNNAADNAAAHREAAAAADRAAAESFERCDTDGFLSQWAHGITARLERAKAEIAEQGGTAEFIFPFTLDGELASTYQVKGQYGYSWLLNDAAAAKLGRRFLSDSSAVSGQRRYANNQKKGIVFGKIRVKAYAHTCGGGSGLAGAASVGVAISPDRDALDRGEYEVMTTDVGPGQDW